MYMTEETRADRTSRSILGMPVYSIQEGQPLGNIKQILVDGKSNRVQGFIVEKRRFSREERFLPFAAVSGFGEDTLTVEKQGLLERKGANQQNLRAIRSSLPIIGARVFTAGGKTLGKVEEYRFSTETGAISGLEMTGDGFFPVHSLVDGSCIIAIAPRTIMLKDEAIDSAIPLDSGFLAGMENAAAAVRERATDLKNNASEAGRRLSANFNEAKERLMQRSEEELPEDFSEATPTADDPEALSEKVAFPEAAPGEADEENDPTEGAVPTPEEKQ